jgi:hypothetical protein
LPVDHTDPRTAAAQSSESRHPESNHHRTTRGIPIQLL